MDKRRKYDLLLVLGILLTAAVLFLLLRPGRAGAWVVVTAYGEEVGRYALSEDLLLTIGEDEYNTLQIKDGVAAVIEANCGDHTCVRTEAVSRDGETIVCLPHHLIVRVEGGEAGPFDAAAQ